ncbi:uncharacterized protein LOC143738551 [Siphateles boraxobius]|uniref:uncharacterized protein LOC143738551 n=1 Tax=Siphateles boraxobius TaxID=180520 RepID=UPI0040647B50
MYDIVIQGWTPHVIESSSAPVEPPTGPAMVISNQQEAVALLNPLTAPTGPPAALIGPPKSPIGQSVSSLAPLVKQSQNLGKRPHSPEGPSAASPVSFEKDEVVEGGCPAPTIVRPNKRKVEVVDGGCPAPATVRPKKRKECPHTVTGSQDYYPVKSVAKYKVIKGQKWKQVEWEPCKLCGKKWPLEWVADMGTC